jgi:hypothetical protein
MTQRKPASAVDEDVVGQKARGMRGEPIRKEKPRN